MTAGTELETIADFFDAYGAALTTGDVPAIAGCYALPSSVVSDAYSFTFASPAAVALSFIGAAPDYLERRLVAAHPEIRDVRRLSPSLLLGDRKELGQPFRRDHADRRPRCAARSR